MSPEVCGSSITAGRLVDEALEILRSDLRPAVELAERDDERARFLRLLAERVREALAVWQAIDGIAGSAVLNSRGERS